MTNQRFFFKKPVVPATGFFRFRSLLRTADIGAEIDGARGLLVLLGNGSRARETRSSVSQWPEKPFNDATRR